MKQLILVLKDMNAFNHPCAWITRSFIKDSAMLVAGVSPVVEYAMEPIYLY